MIVREVNVHQVTKANLEDVIKAAGAYGSYTSSGIVVLDGAGRKSLNNKLELNGCIVIENGYEAIVLYCLDTGEVVRLVED
jgi:hypothetical protein